MNQAVESANVVHKSAVHIAVDARLAPFTGTALRTKCERTHSMQKSLKRTALHEALYEAIRLMRFSCKLHKDISRLLRFSGRTSRWNVPAISRMLSARDSSRSYTLDETRDATGDSRGYFRDSTKDPSRGPTKDPTKDPCRGY